MADRAGGSIDRRERSLFMKLKRTARGFPGRGADDGPRAAAEGRYTLYRLTKRGLGTIEAIEAICRRWNLSSRQVSYGGLKDRHAVTIQYLTILEGPATLAPRGQLRARAGRPACPSLRSAALPGQPVPRSSFAT